MNSAPWVRKSNFFVVDIDIKISSLFVFCEGNNRKGAG